MKKCSKCKEGKELDQFYNDKKSKDGKHRYCKLCISLEGVDYRNKNKENINQKSRETYRKENPNPKKVGRKSGRNPENWSCNNIEYYKLYRENNKENISLYRKEYHKIRYNTDPSYKLVENIRSIIHKGFTNNSMRKSKNTLDILGCTFKEFFVYLENKFEPWMNWDNKGNPKDGIYEPNKTWDLDHIIPISSATSKEEIIKLNHYTNFQPLCSYYNRFIKRDTNE